MMQQHVQGPPRSSEAPNLKGQSLLSSSSSCLQLTDPSDCECDCEGPWDSDSDLDPHSCCSEAPGCCSVAPGCGDFSQTLPLEMSEQIFLRLDPWSLCSAAQTCRRWHLLIHSSEAVWRGQCLLLRAHCGREVDQDRGQGFSWKVTLVSNYARARLKCDWLRGRFSFVRSASELQDVRMVPMDAETWGEILQAELDR